MSTLLAVDGDNIAMTALHVVHARNDGTDPDSRTGAVLDLFLSMLSARIRTHRPERVVVCWDDPNGSWRHERWPQYKGHRASSLDPDARTSGYSLIRHFLRMCGFRQLEAPRFEADDLVAGCWRGATAPVTRVMIFSGDNDYAQLLGRNPHALVAVQVKPDNVDRLYDADWVWERYKVSPSTMPQYKALVGDTSDGIPGVHGIGKVRAVARIHASDNAILELPVTQRDQGLLFLQLMDLRSGGLTIPPPPPFRPFPLDHPRTVQAADVLGAYGLERARSQLLEGEMWTVRQDRHAPLRFNAPVGADQR